MDPKDLSLRLAALEKEVGLLRAEVEAMRAGRASTIRATGRCPACGGDKAVHVPQVLEETHGNPKPLAMSGKMAWWGRTPVAPFEVFACTACGFVEWYVRSFEGVEVDGVNVRDVSVSRPPDGGPYR